MKYFLRILALLCFAPLVFAVETKTFNWIPPTQNTDGTPLNDAQISSYNIFCNTLLLANVVNTGAVDTFTSGPLPAGTYICHATTIRDDGRESSPSNTANFIVDPSDPEAPSGFSVTLP